MGNSTKALKYLISHLLVDVMPTTPLSFSNLGWCEEMCVHSPFEKSMYSSSVIIFLHSICIMLGLDMLQYVLG